MGAEEGTDGMEIEQIGQSASGVGKTKSEPFAIADPTLGQIDLDFDPEKVPLLTLLFEIEKSSTGFVERASLSSSFSKPTNGQSDGSSEQERSPDERVIEALQHSLFCASLFESMRFEIVPSQLPQEGTAQQQRQESVAWLSSEMEQSFLPSPSVMVGDNGSRIGDTQLLSVIHCHEGEVKVQLDDEYSLTVKLIEAGTASAAGTSGTDDDGRHEASEPSKREKSGSQSPSQLKALCRALLLHSQTLYHDHCMKIRTNKEMKDEKPVESSKAPSHILQSCVGLGCKVIFTKKICLVLNRLAQWLQDEIGCSDDLVVQWLPIAFFDSHSRFALLFRDVCIDVEISDSLRLTQVNMRNEFRSVEYSSDTELEYYLKLELRRSLSR